MKRTLSFESAVEMGLVIAGTCLIAGTYGLVRLAYGLFLPDIRASLAMSSAVAGYVSSGASIAYCLGALVGLGAAHRARALVLGALVSAGVGAAGMALSPDLRTFVPLAIVSSAGAGLASPGMVAVVGREIAPTRSDRAQATVNAGTGPGLVAAGLLALVLLPQWRLGLALGAAFTVAAGVGVLVLSRPHPVGRVAVNPDTETDASRATCSRASVRALVVPACGAVLFGAASAVVWTYGRTLLVDEGASGSASTVAWIALGLGGTLTLATAPALSRLHPARAWLVSTTTTAAAIALIGLQATQLPVALLGFVGFGWGFVAATSALIAWAIRLVPPLAAPATSLLFIALVLGQAAGSAVAGIVADRHGLAAAFVLSAFVAMVAAGFGHRVGPRPAISPAVVHGSVRRG